MARRDDKPGNHMHECGRIEFGFRDIVETDLEIDHEPEFPQDSRIFSKRADHLMEIKLSVSRRQRPGCKRPARLLVKNRQLRKPVGRVPCGRHDRDECGSTVRREALFGFVPCKIDELIDERDARLRPARPEQSGRKTYSIFRVAQIRVHCKICRPRIEQRLHVAKCARYNVRSRMIEGRVRAHFSISCFEIVVQLGGGIGTEDPGCGVALMGAHECVRREQRLPSIRVGLAHDLGAHAHAREHDVKFDFVACAARRPIHEI
jgi:hypothetical protein